MVSDDNFLTMKDVEDLIYMEGSRFDILAAVAGRAAAFESLPTAAHRRFSSSTAAKKRKRESIQPLPTAEAHSPSKKTNFKRKTANLGEPSTTSILPTSPPPPPLPTAEPSSSKSKIGSLGVPSSAPKITIILRRPPPPMPVPAEYARAIQDWAGGKNLSPPILVIQKSLFKSDVERSNSRFSIPFRKIENEFLTEEEKRVVGNKQFLVLLKSNVGGA